MDQPTTKPAASALGVVVWLVTAAAILTPLALLFAGYVNRGLQLWAAEPVGQPSSGPYRPPPEPPNAGTPFYIAAGIAAVALAVVGIGLALRSGQIVPRWLLGGVLVITALVVLTNNIEVTREPDHRGPMPCQEHSGGDTTCPGG